MPELHQPLLDIAYLRSIWTKDFEAFQASPESDALHTRLRNWAAKDWQKETTSQSTFNNIFLKDTWSYRGSGEEDKCSGYSLYPQFPVKGAGAGGGTGEADFALGHFGLEHMTPIPQVLGEFKDDRSGLDKPQKSRSNDRTPVEQCLDYLRESRTGLIGPVLPTWGFVTDMNEVRLYMYGDKTRYQRFVITPENGDSIVSLLHDGKEAAFQRFLFYRIFHFDWMLSTSGKSKLEQLLSEQVTHEQALEKEFYLEYHAFREVIYQALRSANPRYEEKGRLRQLVKFTQRILDRCLFILYCEDMGQELNFPPNVLRHILIDVGANRFFDPNAQNAWTEVKRLFVSMRDGTPFGSERINRFNGGLFAEDTEMDALNVPNRVFCEHNQGDTAKRLLQFPKTLLFFSSKYNFGTADDGEGRNLTLTAMGRIFEQSITDLEVMEARAENRESLNELSKRKSDGVYYTPEWVTYYIVEETIGVRLAEIRTEIEFAKFTDISAEQIANYRKDNRTDKIVGEYIKALYAYSARLDALKVVDPACGSGAFLIQAFIYLYRQRQWVANELARVTGSRDIFDTHSAMRSVLSNNLYGVDINAESVEITRLALWLHTALSDRPLTSLDKNIRCGNSLVGDDFYEQMAIIPQLFGEDECERVNAFDWEKSFPDVFQQENPGFDCVIGNPPYVKIQHFRKIQEDVAKYLIEATRENGKPLYESVQTGNFDLYLPFIERGIDILNKEGKMGYIAPNVWMVNQYGKGLRQKLKHMRRLDRWIDFKSFQVFDEAITYTALQFFGGNKQDRIQCVFAPNGREDISAVNWSQVKDFVLFEDLPEKDSWVLLPNNERLFYERLLKYSKRLDESCNGITVGIQTSADNVYHLQRVGPNRYLQRTKGKKEPIEIKIEDAITHPLVSGPEAKRYRVPVTSTYLLHPYEMRNGKPVLLSEEYLRERFPNAWCYLQKHENILRGREENKMNRDSSWWAYNYPKNLDKQEIPKLCVAQTVPEMRVCFDSTGDFYLNNVRVNGIIPADIETGWFLLGVLNGPVCNYIFKRIAKPKAGGYFEANKQFIAPLPIPVVSDEEKVQVADLAKELQDLHTQRRDMVLRIDRRLDSGQCEDDHRDEGWLWADVKPVPTIKKDAPPELKGQRLSAWAKAQREIKISSHLDMIDSVLRQGTKLTVENEDGELKLMGDGLPLIEGVFMNDEESEFIAAQWRQKARQTNATEKFDAKRLIGLFLKLRRTDHLAIREQIIKIDADIRNTDTKIAQSEADMNTLTYKLYKLSEEDIRLVEGTG